MVVEVADQRNDPAVPSGRVLAQQPRAGFEVRRGRRLKVVLSLGGRVLEVPDLVGQPSRTVEITLRREGFFPGNEVASFNRALEGCVDKESAAAPWYKNKVVMAGAGALVLVGVLAVAMGGGGDEGGGGGGNALPGFPTPPTSP